MRKVRFTSEVAACLLFGVALWSQQSSAPSASSSGARTVAESDTSTIRGCLDRDRGNYIVIEKTGMVYALRGVGNKLESQVHHEVEVKGRLAPGSIKTGIRPEKGGSNPSDTVHGVDGTPFQVDNVQSDVQTISKRCQASDR
jgi:hypothetical protein